MTTTLRKHHILGRFQNLKLAKSFSARTHPGTHKASRIFLGDCPEYWVVTMAEGERLLAEGYEELPR